MHGAAYPCSRGVCYITCYYRVVVPCLRRTVSCVVHAGADVNAQTRGMGATALHRAAAQGHTAVVDTL